MEEDTDPVVVAEKVEGDTDPVAAEQADTHPAEEEVEEGIDPAEKEVEGGIDSVAAEQADTHPVVG